MSYPQFQPFPPQYAQPAQGAPQGAQQPPMQPQYAPPQYAPQFMQQPPMQPPMQPQYAQPPMQPPAQGVPMMGNPFASPQQFMQQPPMQPMQPSAQPPANPFAMFTAPAPAPATQGAQQPAQGAAGQPFVAPAQQGAAAPQQPAAGQGGGAAAATDPTALQAQINDLRAQQQAWHVRTQLTQLAGEMGAINPDIVHRLVAEHFRANDAGQLMVASDPRMNPKEALAAFLHAHQYLLRPLVPGGGSGAATPTGGPPMQPPVDPRTAQGATAVANNVMASALGLRQPQQPMQQPQYPQGYGPQYPAQGYAPQQPASQPFGLPSQPAQFQYPVR